MICIKNKSCLNFAYTYYKAGNLNEKKLLTILKLEYFPKSILN
jgi:hypothetical protein